MPRDLPPQAHLAAAVLASSVRATLYQARLAELRPRASERLREAVERERKAGRRPRRWWRRVDDALERTQAAVEILTALGVDSRRPS